jgi:heme oxygenase
VSPDLPRRLRAETHDLHTATERTAVMASLIAGRIARPVYCSLLRNLHALYAALEDALHLRRSDAAVALIDVHALQRAPALARDLEALQGPGWRDALPLQPATRTYVARLRTMADGTSRALLAHAYVRYLGDLYGGQIAKGRAARALGSQASLHFYDFGPEDRVLALRQGLRDALAGLPITAAEADAIVAEARWAFQQHQQLFSELASAQGQPASV